VEAHQPLGQLPDCFGLSAEGLSRSAVLQNRRPRIRFFNVDALVKRPARHLVARQRAMRPSKELAHGAWQPSVLGGPAAECAADRHRPVRLSVLRLDNAAQTL